MCHFQVWCIWAWSCSLICQMLQFSDLHIVLIICSLLCHQDVVFICSIFLPVGNLLAVCVDLLNSKRNDRYMTSDMKSSYDSHVCMMSGFNHTLIRENGSFCSWSRYFSMLKKVSKKMWDILHLLRSRRVILPGHGKIFTLDMTLKIKTGIQDLDVWRLLLPSIFLI